MPWKSKRPDYLMETPGQRQARAYFRAHQTQPCAVCHQLIDYTWTKRKVGDRWVYNPRGLVAGHIVARVVGKTFGYSEDQLQSLDNFRPECRTCSVRQGSRLGLQVQQRYRTNGKPLAKRLRRARSKSYAQQEEEIRRWYAEP